MMRRWSVPVPCCGSPTRPAARSGSSGASLRDRGRSGWLAFSTFYSTGVGERIRISADGDVGIGTTAPAQRLDVVGNVQATGHLLAGQNVNSTVDVNVGNNLTVQHNATVEDDLIVRSSIRAGTPDRKIADGNGCYYA